MAGIQLSTAGVTLWYAAETAAGTRPTTGYEKISEIKSIPELNPEPDNLETTTLEETEWKTYIPGLKDIGGALSFTANLTEVSMTEWEGVVDAYDTAAADNKATWFCIVIPGLTKALYFTGSPLRWHAGHGGLRCSGDDSLYHPDRSSPVGSQAY